jgi:hypothetical protein
MYQNEKNTQMCKCSKCDKGYIVRTYREKRLGQGGFPLSIKVINKCNGCGNVVFKHDYTDEEKIEFQEYLDEKSESMAKFYAFKRMRKAGEIDDETWNQLVDAGAVW